MNNRTTKSGVRAVCRESAATLPLAGLMFMLAVMVISTAIGPMGKAEAQSDTDAAAQSGDQSSQEGLEVPDDLSAPDGGNRSGTESAEGETVTPDPVTKYTIEERRIGTRLERLTVHRKNGIDETYEVRKVDSLSGNEENQLGDIPNVRRWTLGSW